MKTRCVYHLITAAMQTISTVLMESAYPAYGHVMDQMTVVTTLMRTGTTAVSTLPVFVVNNVICMTAYFSFHLLKKGEKILLTS